MLHLQKRSFPVKWLIGAVLFMAIGCAPTATPPIIVSTTAPANVAPDSAPLPDTISVADAAVKRDAGAFILDVRSQEEWNEYHIPGSTLIPLEQLPTRLSEMPKDKEVVVVCRSGNRSKQGRDILKNAGYTQVTSMAGGLNEWKAASLPTATGQ